MFRSIGSKVNFLLFFLLTTAISVYLIATLWIVDDSQRQNLITSFKRTEQVVDTLLSSRSEEIGNESKLVGVLPILGSVVENGEVNTIRDTAISYQQDLGLAIVDVLNSDGAFVVGADPESSAADMPSAFIVEKALDGGSQVSLAIRRGRFAILGAAPIGIARDPSGILVLGVYLDDAFAQNVAALTKTEVSFILADGTIAGSSLAAEGRKELTGILHANSAAMPAAGKEPSLIDNGSYLIKAKPIRDANDQLLGHLVVQLPLKEAQATLASIFKLVVLIGLGILITALLGGMLFARSITHPIAVLKNVVMDIIETQELNQRADITSRDEIGELAAQFNRLLHEIETRQKKLDEYSRSLEVMVETRTGELRQHQAETREMLDNIEQAIFTYDEDMLVNAEYSAHCHEVFGDDLTAGTKVFDLLFGKSNATQEQLAKFSFEMTLLFGSDRFQWSLSAPGFIKQIERQKDGSVQHLRLTFEPIVDAEEKIIRVLTLVEDVTQVRALEALAETNRRELAKIADLLAFDDRVFQTFITETERSLEECRSELTKVASLKPGEQREVINVLFRQIHTIKGNSRLFKLNSIQDVVHKVEEYFVKARDSESEIGREEAEKLIEQVTFIEAETASYKELRTRVLGRGKEGSGTSGLGEGQMLWMQSILRRLCELSPNRPEAQLEGLTEEARKLLDSAGKVSIRDYLKHYDDMLQTTAPDLDKAVKPIVMKGNCYWIEAQLMAHINEMLIHCLRNTLAHGIETKENRQKVGKDQSGSITLEIWEDHGRLQIIVRDDGRGIHPEEVARKAVSKGLLTEAAVASMSDEAKINIVFMPGFSTAEQASDLSGRGVGLDAVKGFTESLGGNTRVQSNPGRGLTIELNVPAPEVRSTVARLSVIVPAQYDQTALATLQKLSEQQGQALAINTYRPGELVSALKQPTDAGRLAFVTQDMLDNDAELSAALERDKHLCLVLQSQDLLANRHSPLPSDRCLLVEGSINESVMRAAFALLVKNGQTVKSEAKSLLRIA